jgi:DNA polymerase III subunit epsilon
MYNFTAIDFETAQAKAYSICQIGLVRVENSVVHKKINLLIQPPQNFYWKNFINIHGITPAMTAFSPSFAEVWHLIQPYISNQNIVAHNISFDNNCLKQTLAYYHLQIPDYTTHCTYKIYKKKLSVLCLEHNIELNHHDALSDANACARLFLKHLQEQQAAISSLL